MTNSSESLSYHPSTKLVTTVAMSSSWRRLWDIALDRGPKGTHSMQSLFKEQSRPCTGEGLCKVCDNTISAETNNFEHACEHHPTYVGELSSGAVVTTLNEDSSDSIFFYDQLYIKLQLSMVLALFTSFIHCILQYFLTPMPHRVVLHEPLNL